MDDALYMLVICAGVACAPISHKASYSMSQEECFTHAWTVLRRKDQTIKCQSNCGEEFEINVPPV
jgi:hypothetical protein